MTNTKKSTPLNIVFIALFAAIISVAGIIRIPLAGVVPIVLQNMMCILTGIVLGGIKGALPTLLFLVAGILGLPVFSGGNSGIAILLGPTGGFLYGYFFGALGASLIARPPTLISLSFKNNTKKKKALYIFRLSLAAILGFVLIYVFGTIHFMYQTKSNLSTALLTCVLPFILVDSIKIVLTVVVAVPIRKAIFSILYSDITEN